MSSIMNALNELDDLIFSYQLKLEDILEELKFVWNEKQTLNSFKGIKIDSGEDVLILDCGLEKFKFLYRYYPISYSWGGDISFPRIIRGYSEFKEYGDRILDLNLEYYLMFCDYLKKYSDLGNDSNRRIILKFCEASKIPCPQEIFKEHNLRVFIGQKHDDFKAEWRSKKDSARHLKNMVPSSIRFFSTNCIDILIFPRDFSLCSGSL